jgi:hypothetical protein
MSCPFCLSENSGEVLVCARDIAIPASLITERDDLLRKRDRVRDELRRARQEIETIITRGRSR